MMNPQPVRDLISADLGLLEPGGRVSYQLALMVEAFGDIEAARREVSALGGFLAPFTLAPGICEVHRPPLRINP